MVTFTLKAERASVNSSVKSQLTIVPREADIAMGQLGDRNRVLIDYCDLFTAKKYCEMPIIQFSNTSPPLACSSLHMESLLTKKTSLCAKLNFAENLKNKSIFPLMLKKCINNTPKVYKNFSGESCLTMP